MARLQDALLFFVSVKASSFGVILIEISPANALLLDLQGRPFSRNFLIRWEDDSIHDVVLREPYIVAFGARHFEIYHSTTMQRLQLVRTDYRLISTSDGLITIRTSDSRLLKLQFNGE
ncbi:hypothetical protein H0H92_005890 [Tricholoma furcatifolium]|nr:hypothetical protein H0H92_005890 [Tricholoma furcatifolium]